MAIAALTVACSQQHAASSPSSAASTSPPSNSAGGSGSRCLTAQLQISIGPTNGATGNEITSVMLTNRSTAACYLGGYPGVALLDRNGRDLQDARRSTNSFFGNYPPAQRVDIPPGGSASFDLTWGGNDPCGDVPAQHPTTMKITPPNDDDSATITLNPPPTVCPNTLEVHPLGSRPQQG